MKLSLNRVSLLFALVLLTACAGNKSSVSNEPNKKPKVDNAVSIKKVWSRSIGGSFKKDIRGFQLGHDSEVVYGATSSGNFAAFDKQTGKKVWSKNAKKQLSAGINTGFENVYIANANGQVLAFDKKSGEQKWQAQLKSEVLVAPVEAGNIAIIRSQDGKIIGFDSATGEQKWAVQREVPNLSLRLDIAPVIAGTVAIIGLPNGQLLALDTRLGRALWDLPISIASGVNELERMRDIAGQPLINQTTVYLNSFQGEIVSVDGTTRRIRWSKKISSHQQMAEDITNIYATGSNSTIIAIDKQTGEILWQNDILLRRGVSGPTVIGNYILVFGNDGDMYLFTRERGELIGNYSFPGKQVIGSPIVTIDPDSGKNVFYALSDNGTIYSYLLDPK